MVLKNDFLEATLQYYIDSIYLNINQPSGILNYFSSDFEIVDVESKESLLTSVRNENIIHLDGNK